MRSGGRALFSYLFFVKPPPQTFYKRTKIFKKSRHDMVGTWVQLMFVSLGNYAGIRLRPQGRSKPPTRSSAFDLSVTQWVTWRSSCRCCQGEATAMARVRQPQPEAGWNLTAVRRPGIRTIWARSVYIINDCSCPGGLCGTEEIRVA